MSSNLIVVESPAKAKTIEKYLGKDYKVISSVGHIVDLPSNGTNIDVEHDFTPHYEVIKGKEKVVARIKTEAKKVDKVLLASDPDREGEAIAYHVYEQIKSTIDKNTEVVRVKFNEITKKGILEGIQNQEGINYNRVNAQQARRIIDRLVGYEVSPLLWKPLKYGLSAGRVQSVALKCIVQREDLINQFKQEEYWELFATLSKLDNKNNTLIAKLEKYKNDKLTIPNEKTVQEIKSYLAKQHFVISNIENKNLSRKPQPPFITSTLQQDATNRLNFSVKKTMSVAQNLYEGVQLGSDYVGLITYMRTDSIRISADIERDTAIFIEKNFGKQFAKSGGAARKTSSKQKVQDAHEAIRPTDVYITPDKIKNEVSSDLYRLYKLIWERFVASQMANAEYETYSVFIDAGDYQFKSSTSKLIFPGFKRVYNIEDEQNSKDDEAGSTINFPLSLKEQLNKEQVDASQHFTQPPRRFTEASLVKELETNGIGRPSTYASIISTLISREYVELKEKKFYPTELGRIVNTLLSKNFHKIFEINFTANLENYLDDVEAGTQTMLDVIRKFYDEFKDELDKCKDHFDVDLTLSQVKCPQCGSNVILKYGKNGVFATCSNYPECNFSRNIARNEDGSVVLTEREAPKQIGVCEKCGNAMLLKKARFGEFAACSNYPDCDNIKKVYHHDDGRVIIFDAKEVVAKCPKCETGGLVIRKNEKKANLFAGCNNYPSCRATVSVTITDDNKFILDEADLEKLRKAPKSDVKAAKADKDGKTSKVSKAKSATTKAKSATKSAASVEQDETIKAKPVRKAATKSVKSAAKPGSTEEIETSKATVKKTTKSATKTSSTTAKKSSTKTK